MADPLDIPKFLQIPQAERKAAWDKLRAAAKPLPPEQPPKLRPIGDVPGATNDDISNDT